MIRLNLLPQEEKSRRMKSRWNDRSAPTPPREGASAMVYLIVVPALLAAVGALGYIYYSDVYKLEREKTDLQQALNGLRTEVSQLETQYSGLREAAALFEQQSRVLDMLMPENRILWSEKFQQISDCLPDNVYLTHLLVDETVTEVQTAESIAAHQAWEAEPADSRGPEPAAVTVPSIVQSLSIEGIAFAEEMDQRIRLVLRFRDNLSSYSSVNEDGESRRFLAQFIDAPRIEYNRIRDVAGVNVNEFRLVLQTVDLATLGQTPPPPPPVQTAQGAANPSTT